MKSLDILLTILDEAQINICASTQRDQLTIRSRYKDEGESFLGITLPLFAQWLEESLEFRRVSTWIYSRFRKRPKRISVLPCFLHGLTSRIFDAKTGLLLESPDINAVFFVRQICLFYKKVFKVCDPARDRQALKTYKEVDDSLRSIPAFPQEFVRQVELVSRRILPTIERHFLSCIDDESILPRHGPGATADKAWANGKYKGREFLRRWSSIFSWEELYGFSTIHQSEGEVIPPGAELPVKVVSVPKTMKTSRIICVEPTVMQYAQQLTAARFIAAIRRSGLYSQFNFDDQRPNQEAARQGSIDRVTATVDLSEASDRVSSKLVSLVFRHSPRLLQHLNGCRTARAMMPGANKSFALRKFASMGSALTFPVEAFCFYVLCTAAVASNRNVFRKDGRPKDLLDYEIARKSVLVFGDDLIVPTDAIEDVVRYLEAFGLKVNSKKSFSNGDFRESCGHDYYRGIFITPTYLRRDPPESHRDADAFVSWVQMSNRFFKSGLWHTAEEIRRFIDKMFRLPLVRDTCAGLGWHHYTGAYQVDRTKGNNGFDWLVKTLVPTSGKLNDELTGDDRLLFYLLNKKDSEEYRSDPTKSPKRSSLRLRRRVVPAY
jgi:hypothetical protein